MSNEKLRALIAKWPFASKAEFELLADFERTVRLEEAEYWFARRWSKNVSWKAVIANKYRYMPACCNDAKRIAALSVPQVAAGPTGAGKEGGK